MTLSNETKMFFVHQIISYAVPYTLFNDLDVPVFIDPGNGFYPMDIGESKSGIKELTGQYGQYSGDIPVYHGGFVIFRIFAGDLLSAAAQGKYISLNQALIKQIGIWENERLQKARQERRGTKLRGMT